MELNMSDIILTLAAFGGITLTILAVFYPFIAICWKNEFAPKVVDSHIAVNGKNDAGSATVNSKTKKVGFWRRQFQSEATKNQRVFDWVFGVAMPVVCFAFDPIVFRNNWGGHSLLSWLKPSAYILSFVSIMAMMAWLIWGEKLKGFNAVLSGLFFLGGIVSFLIGLVLFPFSLIGLIVIVGILGFTPLFTSVIFLRNATRAFQTARPFISPKALLGTAILTAMFGLLIPATINVETNRFLKEIVKSDAQNIQNNAWKLKLIAPIVDLGVLVNEYYRVEKEPVKPKVIADVYFEITGNNIEKQFRD